MSRLVALFLGLLSQCALCTLLEADTRIWFGDGIQRRIQPVISRSHDSNRLGVGRLRGGRLVLSESNQTFGKRMRVKLLQKAEEGKWEEAFQVAELMLDESSVSDASWLHCLFQRCSQLADWRKAIELLNRCSAQDVPLDVLACNSVMEACVKSGENLQIHRVLSLMNRSGVHCDERSFMLGIQACEMDPRIHRWQASSMLQRMLSMGLQPNETQFDSVIRSHLEWSEIDQACKLLEQMRTSGYTPNMMIYEGVVNSTYSLHIHKLFSFSSLFHCIHLALIILAVFAPPPALWLYPSVAALYLIILRLSTSGMKQ